MSEFKRLEKEIEIEFQKLKEADIQTSKLDKLLDEYQEFLKNKILETSKISKSIKINENGLKEFLDHYWTWDKIPVIDGGKITRYEVVISIPKIWNDSVGWFWKSELGYNKFKVNSVTNMLGLLPKHMKDEIDFPEPLNVKLAGNGSFLIGSDVQKIGKDYSEHIEKILGNKAYIKKNSYYEIVKELVKSGTNPFDINPIPEDLFDNKNSNVELHEYQNKSLQKFFKYGRILILYPTGGGKSFPALEALNKLKPPHVIFAGKYSTSVQQWKDRIKVYCPDLDEDDVDIFTYQGGLTKSFEKEYTLAIYDEVHHITGKEWINMTKINVKCVMGLTASPYNETEGADEMIVALTGIPDMPDWNYFYKEGIIKKPVCNIWIAKNKSEKDKILEKILSEPVKTIVFCDGISELNRISKKHKSPFISGSTKSEDRIKIVNENLVTFASRIFDESGSIPDLEKTIEYEHMGKSRTQSLQRVGRLLHNQDKTKELVHHIIMTYEEFEKDQGRLIVFSEKEFQVKWHYDQAEFNARKEKPITKKPKIIKPKKEIIPKQIEIDEDRYPLTKNKRVKKIISRLSSGDVKALLPFLMRGKTQEGWTVRELMDEYAQLVPNNVNRKFKNILHKGYIKKQDKKFVQNIV